MKRVSAAELAARQVSSTKSMLAEFQLESKLKLGFLALCVVAGLSQALVGFGNEFFIDASKAIHNICLLTIALSMSAHFIAVLTTFRIMRKAEVGLNTMHMYLEEISKGWPEKPMEVWMRPYAFAFLCFIFVVQSTQQPTSLIKYTAISILAGFFITLWLRVWLGRRTR